MGRGDRSPSPGGLDSQIRDRDYNDLPALLARYPKVTAIAFNGCTAARLRLKVLGEHAATYHNVSPPSSTPTYTLSYAANVGIGECHQQSGELIFVAHWCA